MQLRYRYRMEPTAKQREALAKAFGCARVVYNDGLRLREDAYQAGLPFIPDADLMRLVTTKAKQTPERRWLSEVSAVILQQSVADLHRAYRNYFRAVAEFKAARAPGEKAVLRVHRPRFKSKHHDQAVRFTANSRFRVLPNGRLRLPKVGEVRIRWSRPLPADPSSVTVTLDRAGRYHASFVVKVAEVSLPAVESAVGIDLGLTTFAALSTGEKVVNPRWLRQRERALRRSQRNMSRKQNGSRNQEKARRAPGLPPPVEHPTDPREQSGLCRDAQHRRPRAVRSGKESRRCRVEPVHPYAGVQGIDGRADHHQGRPVASVVSALFKLRRPDGASRTQ